MIDEQHTLEIYGYTSAELKPYSHKPIVAVCDRCGTYRVLSKSKYGKLCRSCSAKNSVAVKAKADAQRGVPHTPEHCAAITKGLQESGAVKAATDAKRGVPHSPKWIAAIKKGLGESEAVKAHNESMCGVPLSPEHSYAITKGLQESDAVKANGDRMRGGNDIVWHHTLYDHSDLSKNRVAMTRRSHNMGHHVLRLLEIKIPHINFNRE